MNNLRGSMTIISGAPIYNEVSNFEQFNIDALLNFSCIFCTRYKSKTGLMLLKRRTLEE